MDLTKSCSSLCFNYTNCVSKTYFKEDFIAATMTTELTNTSKLRELVEELKRLKKIRPS